MAEMFLEQGIKEMRSSNLFVLSFSLVPEIEIYKQVCQDINEKHEADVQHNDFVISKPVMREKSTRQIKLGPNVKSPYVERVVDINKKYTNEDIILWRFMMLKNRDNM